MPQRVTEAPEQPVMQARRGEHAVEGGRQLAEGRRRVQFHPQVAPAVGDAIAIVLVADVVTADESDGVVDQQQLAVVAQGEEPPGQGIEDARLAAGVLKLAPVVRGQARATKGVEQQLYADPAPRRGGQGGPKAVAGPVGAINVIFQADRVPGPGHGGQHPLKGLRPGRQPARGGNGSWGGSGVGHA